MRQLNVKLTIQPVRTILVFHPYQTCWPAG